MPFSVATSATLPRRPTVAEDCDPPATRGDGALAIVSVCQLLRRRGRTPLATACAAHFVRGLCRYCQLPTTNYQLFSINYISTLLHGHFPRRRGAVATTRPFSTTARAHPSCDRLRGSLRSGDMSLLHGHFPRRRGAVATGGTRSRASAFSSMRSLVLRPCGPVPGHQASSRCLRRAIEAASARFVAPSLAKMALTCSLTV